MRAKRILWIRAGRPRDIENPLYIEYKDAKRIFRKILRNLYAELERELFNKIDIAAEKDQHLFWNLLNRNKGWKNRISELVANGSTYRTPKEITKVWSDYFQDLYTPKANDNFDDDHKCSVEQSIATMLTASHTNYKHTLDDDITYDEVCFAINSLKRNKACGFDSIANEQLLHGGAIVCSHLTTLFNMFMTSEHIPSNAKRGLIITIPKAGKQSYARRESYRGITLLPSIYKLFETVVLNRFKQAINMYNLKLCHPLQNAYQTGLCSIMTSFILQETVNYNLERGSKTYCCMLDASSAFDTVWHDGLYFKLYNIRSPMACVTRSLHKCEELCTV